MTVLRLQVQANTKIGEFVFVSGDTDSLGQWMPGDAIEMTKQDASSVWSTEITVATSSLKYRYFIGIILWQEAEPGKYEKHICIRQWESNFEPRQINVAGHSLIDIFGDYDGNHRISQGCLTGEKCCIVSLPVNAIQWLPNYKGSGEFLIRASPIEIKPSDGHRYASHFEVTVLDEKRSVFTTQPIKGTRYTNDHFMFKNLFMDGLIGIQLQFFSEDSDNLDVASCVLFEDRSPGVVYAPIIDKERNVVGRIKVHHLIINPYPLKPFNLEHGLCTKFHNYLKGGVHVGHRGAGVRRREDLSDNILENTILSLNHAVKHGADMVEFDVHLSKDDVPILYHDFSVYVALTKKGSNDHETLELPVKDLTYQQLKILKLGPKRDHGKQFEFMEADSEDNQPFCKLEHALKTVSPCAFNIEIKYPTGSGYYKDLNHFVDTILETTFEHHNNRDIIISSFDPDICAMVNKKQKKFPVLFLTYTEDRNIKSNESIEDSRMASIEMACYYSSAMSFSGVNCYAHNLITDKSLVRFVINKDLLLFCYGDHINARDVVEDLIKEGVHGVIYDRIDVISPKKLLSSVVQDAQAAETGDNTKAATRKTSATIFGISHSS